MAPVTALLSLAAAGFVLLFCALVVALVIALFGREGSSDEKEETP
jgi:hypothetical protein